MSSLAKLIFFRIFRTTIYSTVALTICAWIVKSSRYLELFSNSNISLYKFTKFTSYLCVDLIAVVIPISLAISAAFVFQRFKDSNQLVALQSAGGSPETLLRPLLALSVLTVCYLFISNSYVSPKCWIKFRDMEFNIKNNIDPPENAGVIFSNRGFSVYAQIYKGDFFFENLFIIDGRNPKKNYSYFAKVGVIRNNILSLTDGERIEIDFESKRNSVTRFASYRYDLNEFLAKKKRQPQVNEKTLRELMNFDTKNQEDLIAQKALLHQKLLSPFLAIVFSLLSFFMVLLTPHSRVQNHSKMWMLMITIVVLQGIYFWIANASAKNPMFINLNYAFIMLSILVLSALILTKRRL